MLVQTSTCAKSMCASQVKLTWRASKPGCSESAVLFLHGFMGTSGDWDEILSGLSKDGFFCVVLDLPYHGACKKIETHSVNETATLILNLVDAQNILNLSVVGYSMGGRVALELCKLIENAGSCRVQSLVLVSVHLGLESVETRLERRKSDGVLATKLEGMNSCNSSAFNIWLDAVWYSSPIWGTLKTNGKYQRMLRKRSTSNEPAALAASLRSMSTGRGSPSWRYLSKCKFPVLYMHGSLDQKYSKIAEQLSKRCPDINTMSIPGAGHNVLLQKPEETVTKLANFLQEISVSPR